MGSGPRDYVAIADAYAREAVADRKGARYGKWVRLAAKRYLEDRRRAKQRGNAFVFDPWHAADACGFIEQLPHVEGKWDTPTIVMHPSHVFFVVNVFGFRDAASGARRFTSALFAVARKNAKALALDTPVPTPGGWRTIAEIGAGDRVFGADGNPCRVLATSEVFIGKPCYQVRFSDGSSVTASGDHLWETTHRYRPWASPRVNGSGNGGRWVTGVVTTEQIAGALTIPRPDGGVEFNHSIRVAKQLETPAVRLPIDPYMLGAWLGDGTTAAAHITCGDQDIEHFADEVRRVVGGEPVLHRYGTAWRLGLTTGRGGRVVKAQTIMRDMGVLHDKHIPEAYLWAGTEQRRALLQGLMDTDGSIAPTGRAGAMACTFVSTNHRLADGVLQIVRSLGMKGTIAEGEATLHGKVVGPRYLVQFTAWAEDAVFRLARKAARLAPRPQAPRRSSTLKIIGCDRVESVPTKCLMVDSPGSLFLAGRGMTATHNSTLAAAILLYCMCCENEPGAQVITAATTGQQARIVFNVAKRMVESTPDLRESFMLEPFANAIARYDVAASFKPINAKASTQDGLNPSHCGIDEIHAHKTHDLLAVLQSAAGARGNPLWLFTTTEGYETPGPWPEIRRFAQQLLEGAFAADHYFAVIYAIDDKDRDYDAKKWIKANPLMDVNPILAREIAKEAVEAKRMPGKAAEFRIKRLNRQSASAKAWVRLDAWQRCAGVVDLDALVGKPCSAGLDLASTSDLTVFRLTWLVDGVYYTYGKRWVPADAVVQRTERGTVPYAAWVEAGLLTQTDGDVTDYAVIEAEIVALCERFAPVEIAFDRWNAQDLCNRLIERELPMVEFIQGPKSYHPMMQELERAYIGGKLVHGGDPILQWCAANVVPRYDANMNAAPDKKRSAEKIDDFTALCMSLRGLVGVADANPEPGIILL